MTQLLLSDIYIYIFIITILGSAFILLYVFMIAIFWNY